MRFSRYLFGWALCAMAGSVAASGEDEIWIERYMSEPGNSAQPSAIRRGYRIAWADLKRFIGVPVKISTDSGTIHRGQIQRANDREILLRARLHGGYADLSLRRDQVINTELE